MTTILTVGGTWQTIKTYHGRGGSVVGEGLILRSQVNGQTIWVEGMKDLTGHIRVTNAGVD